LAVASQALGGQGHTLLTLELDLNADRGLHIRDLLLSDALLLDCGDLRDLSAKHTGVLLPILRWNDDPAAAAGRPRGVSLGGSCVLSKE